MTDYPKLLSTLVGGGVRFIIVGGAAATAHGSVRLTVDLDVVYDRGGDNVGRLAAALAPHRPYLRGSPEGLPFRLDEATLRAGLNFTLNTSIGAIDLLGEIAGGGTYQTLEPDSLPMTLFGHECRVLGLARLIEVKRAAGRPKDLEAIAELEALRDMNR
ncbi:MAG TPA: hypothetical protein VIX63_15510 [Vicinamibacterales bacterium]